MTLGVKEWLKNKVKILLPNIGKIKGMANKMNKKLVRIISIILIIISVLFIINSTVLAKSGDDIINDGRGWIGHRSSKQPN